MENCLRLQNSANISNIHFNRNPSACSLWIPVCMNSSLKQSLSPGQVWNPSSLQRLATSSDSLPFLHESCFIHFRLVYDFVSHNPTLFRIFLKPSTKLTSHLLPGSWSPSKHFPTCARSTLFARPRQTDGSLQKFSHSDLPITSLTPNDHWCCIPRGSKPCTNHVHSISRV